MPVIRLADTGELMPVPWADLKLKKDGRSLVRHARQYHLKPNLAATEVKNRAPALTRKEMQAALAPPDRLGDGAEMPALAAEAPATADKSCPGCSIVRGQVQKAEGELLVLRDSETQQDLRLHIDNETESGQAPIQTSGEFRPGDRVEVYVTPEGHALTVSMIRAPGHMEMPDN
jgi:hypothetical protein